jgi:hypothetical protein
MEKYATYNYYKNKATGEIKKISLHDDLEAVETELKKEGSTAIWVKITNENEIEKIENQE